MSTLQHINSVVNYNWPELSRKYSGFDKPQIVPASTLRGIAPIYLRSAIDQSEDSYFMFIAGDPTKGDCSREKACEFFDELFYEKLQMPSSYEANEGYTRTEAIDKEVLPPATNQQFRNFYDEQMAKIDAEKERQRRIDNLGFDPDDGDTIDVDVDVDDGSQSDTRAVGQAQTTAVGMPKKIFYCVDFHCPAGGMLGYNGGAGGRLGGRRPGGYLREAKQESPLTNSVRAYDWAKTKGLDAGLVAIAAAEATKNDPAEFLPYIFKYQDGTVKYITEDITNHSFTVEWEGPAGQFPYNHIYMIKEVTVLTKEELDSIVSECDADPEKMMKEFVELAEAKAKDPDADDHLAESQNVDPDDILGEENEVEEDEYRRPKNQPHNLHQVDEGEDVEEDEYRRPKNQPHNLHRVDESDAWVADIDADGQDDVRFIVYASSEEDARKEAENEIKSHKLKNAKVKSVRLKDEKSKDDDDIEDAEDLFDENESQFELNESMIRFCDRLIRG